MTQAEQKYYGKTADGPEDSEHLKFWLGFSTAYGPFNYVSPLESIIAGKRHCGIFLDIPFSDIDLQATIAEGQPRTPYYCRIPYDITFSGVLDLNQLNPIFNSFPVLKRNYASLYLQLWVQDFLQDLKIVWLNKSDTIQTVIWHMQ
ncbi:MAG: hypothetical protein EZS28_009116 [Streblomastix strix]|uniref:Uncharacterized protein n=1 Tax=Streblomastix strix TaxID=222440 RepID=A0A5J4WJW9_9EUKA|nr:MAG: hypothetical protein EZS28_009116 [Streblomastix strix]